MKKIIINTERIIPDNTYLNEWFDAMEETDVPRAVLSLLRESGHATWATIDGQNQVTTTYEIKEIE